ncbi:MAG: hypothetical protein HWQ23_12870 [Nostoc sp. JL33]|nr:hypothetical protein [Nostoc sp. JL33]MBN3871123.1 hypothetical protein [Nostoc sp. JL33]
MPPARQGRTAVPHGGNPLGASLSLWEKTGLPHRNALASLRLCGSFF